MLHELRIQRTAPDGWQGQHSFGAFVSSNIEIGRRRSQRDGDENAGAMPARQSRRRFEMRARVLDEQMPEIGRSKGEIDKLINSINSF